MHQDLQASARHRYFTAIRGAAERDLGEALSAATNVVATADREGSTAAVVYPLGDSTIIWCAPEVRPRIAELDGSPALDVDGFVRAAADLGGTFVGAGNHRVLAAQITAPTFDPDRLVTLDRSVPADVDRITEFVGACGEDDLDEAELDLDELDPAIFAVLDEHGAIAAYASARPWSIDRDFDDIAVITHPERRGLGLGVTAVRTLVAARQPMGRLMFYNCDVENLGSNRVAASLGFDRVVTVAAASFD